MTRNTKIALGLVAGLGVVLVVLLAVVGKFSEPGPMFESTATASASHDEESFVEGFDTAAQRGWTPTDEWSDQQRCKGLAQTVGSYHYIQRDGIAVVTADVIAGCMDYLGW